MTTAPAEIEQLLNGLSEEQTELRRFIARIMWHMRGSLSREEAWTLSHNERRDVLELIEEHKDLTEKTGLPLM